MSEEKQRKKEHTKTVEAVKQHNERFQNHGEVVLFHMTNDHIPDFVDGYMNIFPNVSKVGTKTGYHLAELSPERLGPVLHSQPDLPPCTSLDVFMKFSMYDSSKETKEEFKQTQRNAFEHPEQHNDSYKHVCVDNADGFVWVDKQGKEHLLGVIESRQFYFTFYERLVETNEKAKEMFEGLVGLVQDGYNIQLCGPRAQIIHGVEDIERVYRDPTNNIGHEFALYCLLMYHLKEITKKDIPWHKHKRFDF